MAAGAWWPLRRSGSLPSGDSREGSLALTPLTAVIQLVNRRTSAAAAAAADWGDDNTRSPHAWGKLRSIAGKELRSQVHMGASIAVCCSGAVDSNIRLAVCTGTTGVAVYSLRADGCLTRAAQLEIPGAGGADGLPASPAAHPRTRRYTTGALPAAPPQNCATVLTAQRCLPQQPGIPGDQEVAAYTRAAHKPDLGWVYHVVPKHYRQRQQLCRANLPQPTLCLLNYATLHVTFVVGVSEAVPRRQRSGNITRISTSSKLYTVNNSSINRAASHCSLN